jgi:hypothetical protein
MNGFSFIIHIMMMESWPEYEDNYVDGKVSKNWYGLGECQIHGATTKILWNGGGKKGNTKQHINNYNPCHCACDAGESYTLQGELGIYILGKI